MPTFVHYMSGPTVIEFNSVELGYAEDRVQIQVQPYYDDIHTDNMGGLAGPPSDSQLLGAIANITAVLTKYVKAEMDKLTSFDSGGSAGVLPDIGSFVKQDALYAALVLTGTNETITFDYAHLRQAQEFNASVRHKRYAVGWQAWMDDACTRTLMEITAGVSSCVP